MKKLLLVAISFIAACGGDSVLPVSPGPILMGGADNFGDLCVECTGGGGTGCPIYDVREDHRQDGSFALGTIKRVRNHAGGYWFNADEYGLPNRWTTVSCDVAPPSASDHCLVCNGADGEGCPLFAGDDTMTAEVVAVGESRIMEEHDGVYWDADGNYAYRYRWGTPLDNSVCEAATDLRDCHVADNVAEDCGLTLAVSDCVDDRSGSTLRTASCEELEAMAEEPGSLVSAGVTTRTLSRAGYGDDSDTCHGATENPDVVAVPADRVRIQGDTAEVQLPDNQLAIVPESNVSVAASGMVLVLASPGSPLTISAGWAAMVAAIGPVPVVGQIVLAGAAVIAVGMLVYTYWDEITEFCTWLWDSAVFAWEVSSTAVVEAYGASAGTVQSWFAASTALTSATAVVGAGVAVEALIDQSCAQRNGCWVFFKYTNLADFERNVASGGILPSSNGLTYLTWAPFSPADAVQNLFLGRADMQNRADYVMMFTVYTGVPLVPAVTDPLELTYDGGTLRFGRHIDLIYAGPNPFELL